VWFGSGIHEKNADIVIFHKSSEHPYIIIEVKRPKREDGIQPGGEGRKYNQGFHLKIKSF